MQQFAGVIFDMDGTLVDSQLDFERIRRHLGVEPGQDILAAIEAMEPEQSRRSARWLLETELAAVESADLIPHAAETLRNLRQAGLKIALLTRNVAEAMQLVVKRLGPELFDLTWSRENGPIKPEPDGILAACGQMGIDATASAAVGDFEYDLIAARAAGATAILLARGDRPPFAHRADHVISCLSELPALLGVER
ncbi:MAG: HAD family hydrolase [Phycisphaerae bacterium]